MTDAIGATVYFLIRFKLFEFSTAVGLTLNCEDAESHGCNWFSPAILFDIICEKGKSGYPSSGNLQP